MMRTDTPRVLTITRRPAELCAAVAMLNGAGFDVVTATSLPAATAVARAMPCDAAFVCHHSFGEGERDAIAGGLLQANPGLLIVGRCPGCVGCDERAGIAGTLEETEVIAAVIAALKGALRRDTKPSDPRLPIL